MGYTTSFKLHLIPNDNALEIIDALRNSVDYAGSCLTALGNPNEPMTWYKHEEDLKAFSLKYPEVLFLLTGEGEEAGDIWQLHVQNGKSSRIRAEVNMPDVGELE